LSRVKAWNIICYLISILVQNPKDLNPLIRLRGILAKHKDLRTDVSGFWHGRFGEKHPSIPRPISEFLKIIPADLELDF
jgi:hypothetical protein